MDNNMDNKMDNNMNNNMDNNIDNNMDYNIDNNMDNNIDDEILRMVIEESLNPVIHNDDNNDNNDEDYMKAIHASLNESKIEEHYENRIKYNDNFMKNTLSKLENFKNLLNNIDHKQTEININTENIQVKKEHLTLEELRAARLKKFTNKN
jgi:hypothetical protein